MSEPRFCRDCRHFTPDPEGYVCRPLCPVNPSTDYVYGNESRMACFVKNQTGDCKDFEAKEKAE